MTTMARKAAQTNIALLTVSEALWPGQARVQATNVTNVQQKDTADQAVGCRLRWGTDEGSGFMF